MKMVYIVYGIDLYWKDGEAHKNTVGGGGSVVKSVCTTPELAKEEMAQEIRRIKKSYEELKYYLVHYENKGKWKSSICYLGNDGVYYEHKYYIIETKLEEEIKMKKNEFDAWERERIEWVKRTFADDVEVRKVDERTVECRCVLHDFQGEREANDVAYLLATDVCRVMNGGNIIGGPWFVYHDPVYYDRDGHCFEPKHDADFDRVGSVEYVVDRED